jgi:streptogramin lyase
MSRRHILTASVGGAVLAFGGILAVAPAVAAGPTIAEYQLPQGDNTNPMWITPGPGGLVWILDQGLNAVQATNNADIDAINPVTHAFQVYPTGLESGSFGGLAAGPDGNLWFTDVNAPAIGVFSPSTHKFQEFSTGQPTASHPQAIAAGPDGNLWFTDDGDNRAIGEINPTTHAIQDFSLGVTNNTPGGIAPGPNGEMWFTVNGYNPAIGEINESTHAIQEFPVPGPISQHQPVDIVEGPDGNMWFTDQPGGAIGVINPTTHAIQEFTSGMPSGAGPYGIAKGPDGNVWFTDANTPAIGEINPTTHAITELTSNSITQPEFIVTGPDGNMWFSDPSTPAVGEVVLTGGGHTGGGGLATPSVGHVTVSRTAVHVPIGCHGSGTCAFKLTLSVMQAGKAVVVGRSSRSLSGGQNATLTVALSGKGRSLLRKHHTLKVKLVVTSGSSTIATRTLTFKAKK